MKEKTIKFTSANDVVQFVAKADNCDFDIDVWCHHFQLDGKSVLALLSLDFSESVKVKYSGENQNFEEYLSSLAVSGKNTGLSGAYPEDRTAAMV